MAKGKGSRLSSEHKRFLMELLCSGLSSEQIMTAMAEKGYPEVSRQTIATYRANASVQAEIDVCLQHAQLCGLGSRLIRIRALEIMAEEYNLRRRGFVPHPFAVGDSLPGPPVPPNNKTFRTLCDGTIKVFRELDRIAYAPQSTPVVKDGGRKAAGSAETLTTHQSSAVSEANRLADQLEAYIARCEEREAANASEAP